MTNPEHFTVVTIAEVKLLRVAAASIHVSGFLLFPSLIFFTPLIVQVFPRVPRALSTSLSPLGPLEENNKCESILQSF